MILFQLFIFFFYFQQAQAVFINLSSTLWDVSVSLTLIFCPHLLPDYTTALNSAVQQKEKTRMFLIFQEDYVLWAILLFVTFSRTEN